MTLAGAGTVPATQDRCRTMSSTPTTSNASREPVGSQSVRATPAAAAGRTRIALVAPAPSTASFSVQSYRATSAWLLRTIFGSAVSTVKQDAVGSTVAASVAISPGCTVAFGSLPGTAATTTWTVVAALIAGWTAKSTARACLTTLARRRAVDSQASVAMRSSR